MQAGHIKIQDQMQDFIGRIQANIDESQKKTSEGLDATMSSLNTKLEGLLEKINETSSKTGRTQEDLFQKTSSMAATLQSMSEQNAKAIGEQIENLNSKTSEVLKGISDGGVRYLSAAEKLENAVTNASAVISAGSNLLGDTQSASRNLAGATTGLSTILDDYKQTRNEMRQLLSTVKADANSRNEFMSDMKQFLIDMNGYKDTINGYNETARVFLGEITEVLEKSLDAYHKQLENQNTKFIGAMEEAVSKLGGAIRDLSDTVNELEEPLHDLSDRFFNAAQSVNNTRRN